MSTVPNNQVANLDSSFSTRMFEALDWLKKKSGVEDWGILAFNKGSEIVFSSSWDPFPSFNLLPVAAAEGLPKEDLGKTTIFCGPDIHCNILGPKLNEGILLIENDFSPFINSKPKKNIEGLGRLIIVAHGRKDGSQLLIEGQQQRPVGLQPDDFAAKFFANYEKLVVHAISCEIGYNPTKSFQKNSLKENWILLLHAGEDKLPGGNSMEEALSLISNEQYSGFPFPNPLQIIYQDQKKNTIIRELAPVPLKDIISMIEQDKDEIDLLHNLILTPNYKSQLSD